MGNQFLFLDYKKRIIEEKEFICINILEFTNKQVFKIYKPYNDELCQKLDTLDTFDNINNFITFVIKRDGKIALNINI